MSSIPPPPPSVPPHIPPPPSSVPTGSTPQPPRPPQSSPKGCLIVLGLVVGLIIFFFVAAFVVLRFFADDIATAVEEQIVPALEEQTDNIMAIEDSLTVTRCELDESSGQVDLEVEMTLPVENPTFFGADLVALVDVVDAEGNVVATASVEVPKEPAGVPIRSEATTMTLADGATVDSCNARAVSVDGLEEAFDQ